MPGPFDLDFDKLQGVLAAIKGQGSPLVPTTPLGTPQTNPLAGDPGYFDRTADVQQQIDAIGAQQAGLVPSDPAAQRDLGAQPMVPSSSPYALQPNDLGQGGPAGPASPTPPKPPGKPAPSGRVSPIDAMFAPVNQAVDDAALAQGNAAGAQIDAEKARNDRAVAVMDKFNADRAQMDADFQTKRQAARDQANMETGRWLQKLENISAQEPNPQRYWQNTDGFGKALWLMGMAFSGAAQIGMKNAGQGNPVLEMLQQEIQQDIQLQKERQARMLDKTKTEGDIMLRGQQERMSDLRDDFSMQYARYDALEKAALARASGPGDEDKKAANMQAAAWARAQKVNVATQVATQKTHAYESALQRGHAAAMQARLFRHQKEMAKIEIAGKVAAEQAKGQSMRGGFEQKDLRAFDRSAGIQVYNKRTGQTDTFVVPKEEAEKARPLVTNATDTFNAMKRLSTLLKGASSWEALSGNNAEIESLINQLGYQTIKQVAPGDRVTDRDFAAGLKVLLGTNYDSTTGRLLSVAGIKPSPAEIAKFMDEQTARLTPETQKRLAAYLDPRLYEGDGWEVVYSPQNTEPAQAAQTSYADELHRHGVDAKSFDVSTGTGYQQAKEVGQLPPYQGNPDKKLSPEDVARDVAAKTSLMARSADPDKVHALAVQAINKLRDNKGNIADDRAWQEIVEVEAKQRGEAQVVHDEMVDRFWTSTTELIKYVRDKTGREIDPGTASKWYRESNDKHKASGVPNPYARE